MNKKEIKKEIRYLKNYKQRVWTDNEILQHDRLILALEKMSLEQENKQLKEEIQELRADYGNKAQVERDLLEERIDKAIEYIEENGCYCKAFDEYGCVSDLLPYECDELLEILKGDSDE